MQEQWRSSKFDTTTTNNAGDVTIKQNRSDSDQQYKSIESK